MNLETIIKKLLNLTKKCKKIDEFPVAAIIYDGDKIISKAYNKRNKSNKTTDHAEIIAIQKANKKIKSWKLTNLSMIVTLEPCDMCKTVIKESRIKNVYYLVQRYTFKKQYKCTIFSYLNKNNPEITKYIDEMKHFFDNKKLK